MIYCYECGKRISNSAKACPKCGARAKHCIGDKQAWIALVLAFFLGAFGAHRFYVGRTGSAIAMFLLTLTIVGVLITGIWALIDMIVIITGNFTDANGKKLEF